MALDFLKDLAEDLVTLEVATLTNSNAPIDLTTKLTDGQQAKVDAAEKAVKDAKNALIKAIEEGNRPAIRNEKKALKLKEKDLEEMKKAYGHYDPKDIFSKIRAGLSQAEVVAYSRELASSHFKKEVLTIEFSIA